MSSFKYILFLIFMIYFGCTKPTEYEKLLTRELNKGIRFDSLFLGFEFGMSQREFLTKCWNYNQDGILMQGSMNGNMAVQYRINELKFPASLNFYPQFKQEKISVMEAEISYNNWSPWNKMTHSDELQSDVVKLLEMWYGGEFIEINHERKGKALVKVDGNRRISIFIVSERKVRIYFTDMMAEIDKF